MARTKKVKSNENENTSSSNPEVYAVKEQPIQLLAVDFGRADLNLLVETLNQVIKKVNQ